MKNLTLLLALTISAITNGQTVTTLSTDRFLKVNGTKFFPVGIYADGQGWPGAYSTYKYELDIVQAAGFNTMVMDNTMLTNYDFNTFLDYSNSQGMKTMIDFYDNIDANFINTYKNKPSIIGYTTDDAERFTIAQIQERQNTIMANDINHIHICDGSAGDLTNIPDAMHTMINITDGWGTQWSL